MPVTLIARIRAKHGCEAELEKELRKMVANVRGETGCIQYILHRSEEDPRVFVFYEIYSDEHAVQIHRGTPYFVTYRANTAGLREGEPEVDVLAEIERK